MPTDDAGPPGRRSPLRRLSRGVRAVVLVLVVLVGVAFSIAVALLVTPSQTVHAAGQTIDVGVAPPALDWSGPGRLELFGQQIDTSITFSGPVRPSLTLSHIRVNDQLTDFARTPGASAKELQSQLVGGFQRYVVWETVVVAVAAAVVFGAAAGWLRRGRRASVALIVGGVVAALVVNLGAVMVTAYSAPDKLRQIDSLQALTGDSPPLRVTAPRTKPGNRVKVAVIGDSTAAGLGNPLVDDPSADDRACRRSGDAYAEVLARTNDWTVDNLACSGATIDAGILGPQQAGSRTITPQLLSASVARADIVIVSIGANDVHWTDILRVCAVSRSCDNQVERAFLQQQLAEFGSSYLRLIESLQLLPNKPRVLINQYYDPFDGDVACVADGRITDEKKRSMQDALGALNQVLRQGAESAEFATVQPSFAGHGLCSATPYVQGVQDKAPFHPTVGGEFAIAFADQRALDDESRAAGGATPTDSGQASGGSGGESRSPRDPP